MSENGQTHFNNLAMLQNFSDHFAKLCIKGLIVWFENADKYQFEN